MHEHQTKWLIFKWIHKYIVNMAVLFRIILLTVVLTSQVRLGCNITINYETEVP